MTIYPRVSWHDQRAGLGRINTGLVGSALAARGRQLVVLDDAEVDDDLVRDMVEVLTWFCARLYGPGSARNRALTAIGCARRDIGPQACSTPEAGDPARDRCSHE